MKRPLVSVIIVSYNTRDLTVKSIKSALDSRGFKPGDLEIIVVDNNSSDDTVSYLKTNFPDLSLIANSKNRGFGGGNNQGAKIAKGKYLLLLNTDAFLAPNSLKILVEKMESDNTLSSVGPQYRYADNAMQCSAGYSPTLIRVLAWMWWLDKLPLIKNLFQTPYHVFDLNWYKSPHYPDWLMGACVIFRKSEFDSAGGFDEQIFMYAEEVELFRRLKSKTNKRNLFTPETKIIHLGSASTKKANAFRLTHELKGIEYIYKKHYRALFPLVKLFILSGVVLRLAVFLLIPSRHSALKEYLNYFKRS